MPVCHCIAFRFVHVSVLACRVFGGAYVIICFRTKLYINVMMMIILLPMSYYYLHASFILRLFVNIHVDIRVVIVHVILLLLFMTSC